MSGCAATFDIILYPVQQSMKLTHNFELKKTQNAQGDDFAWKANNETVDGEWMMKLVGDNSAHAKAGAAFLAPLAIITVSGADASINNTTWALVPSSSLDFKNDDVGDVAYKVMRYVDSSQQTALATTPS